MKEFPHYEVVIRYPDGVAWAGTVAAETEAEARGKALRRFRESNAFAPGAGAITVEAHWRETSQADSILG
jgi:hypothetical protein